jgi:hypothetical protein
VRFDRGGAFAVLGRSLVKPAMPSFNPFTSVTGKHAFTLFEIR